MAAAVLSVVAINARESAEARRREALAANARSLAEQSRQATGELPVLLALAAVRIAEPEPALTIARQALIDALYSRRAIPSFDPRLRSNRGRVVFAGTSVSAMSFGGSGREGLWLYGRARLAGVRGWEVCMTPEAVCGATDPFGVAVEGPTEDLTDGSTVVSIGGGWLAATAERDDRARVWRRESAGTDAAAFRLHKTIALSDNDETVMALSADGRRLLTQKYRARAADLWDLSADDPASTGVAPPGTPAEVTAGAFSPDDRWLALAAGVTVYLWDVGDVAGPPRHELANDR